MKTAASWAAIPEAQSALERYLPLVRTAHHCHAPMSLHPAADCIPLEQVLPGGVQWGRASQRSRWGSERSCAILTESRNLCGLNSPIPDPAHIRSLCTPPQPRPRDISSSATGENHITLKLLNPRVDLYICSHLYVKQQLYTASSLSPTTPQTEFSV